MRQNCPPPHEGDMGSLSNMRIPAAPPTNRTEIFFATNALKNSNASGFDGFLAKLFRAVHPENSFCVSEIRE